MKGNLWKISASTFLVYGGLAILVYFSLFLKELGLNNAEIGLIVSLFSWTALFSRPLGGRLGDRYSPKTLLILGAGIFSLSLFGFALVGKNIPFIIALRISTGLGFAWYALGSLLQSVEGERLEKFTGNVSTLSVFYLLPYFLYPYLGIRIARAYGFSWMFAAGGLSALASVPLILFLRKTDRRKTIRGKLRITPEVFFLGLMNLLMGWSVNIAFPFIPLLEKVRPGVETGFFFTMVSAVAVFIRAYAGRKFSFWGKPGAFLPGFLGFALGFALSRFASSTFLLVLVGLLIGIGVGTVYPNITSITLKIAPSQHRGITMGFVSSMGDLGFCTGPIIFGYLSYKIGLLNSFLVWSAVVLLLSWGIYFLLSSPLRKKCS